MRIIERKVFSGYDEAVKEVLHYCYDEAGPEEVKSVTILCHYEVAKNMMKALFAHGIDLYALNLEPEFPGGYDKEFGVTVSPAGILCEKAWYEGNELHPAGYLSFEDEYIFIHEDCNSRIVAALTDYTCPIEFGIYDDKGETHDIH